MEINVPKAVQDIIEKLTNANINFIFTGGVVSIYYGDPRYRGQIVKEYPDGRRQLVHIDEKSVVIVIKEI